MTPDATTLPTPDAAALAREAATLARYLLPQAGATLRAPDVAARVTRHYAAAVARHHLPLLADAAGVRGEMSLSALWVWDGLFAPEPGRTRVRQRLLLMSAILEAQPELSAWFLPPDVGFVGALWQVVHASMGTAVSGVLSLALRLTRRGPHA